MWIRDLEGKGKLVIEGAGWWGGCEGAGRVQLGGMGSRCVDSKRGRWMGNIDFFYFGEGVSNEDNNGGDVKRMGAMLM